MIAPSKLGRLAYEHWHSDEVLVRQLRELGLVREDAADDDLLATFKRARDEDAGLADAAGNSTRQMNGSRSF